MYFNKVLSSLSHIWIVSRCIEQWNSPDLLITKTNLTNGMSRDGSVNIIRPSDPYAVRRPMLIQISIHIIVIATDMLGIPPIAPRKALWERSLRTLQSNIPAAHDTQTKIPKGDSKSTHVFQADWTGLTQSNAADGKSSQSAHHADSPTSSQRTLQEYCTDNAVDAA
jgi:hypothetical protein